MQQEVKGCQIITITANGGIVQVLIIILLQQQPILPVNNQYILMVEGPFDVIAYPNPSNYQFTLL
jgi:hypothetical protein